MIPVQVKWNGKQFPVQLDTDQPSLLFKSQIYALTGVAPERQKIMIKGGLLKDDTDLKTLQIPQNHTFLMMGTAGALPEQPKEQVKFIEDMTEQEINVASKVPSGLQNMGNTCYANATVQCLRMMPELSVALKSVQGSLGNDAQRNVTVALRDLFKLLDTQGEEVLPLVFMQMVRTLNPLFAQQDRQGHPMQQDAEEFWGAMTTYLGDLTHGSGNDSNNSQRFIQQFMTGEMRVVLQCVEAPNEEPTASTETFTKLHCHISQNVNFLNSGLQEALTGTLEKRSSTLDRNAQYTKQQKLTRLPGYLTIQFMRFFWKPAERVKAKILRKVKFPVLLDMFEFCDESLQQKLIPQRDQFREREAAKAKAKAEAKANVNTKQVKAEEEDTSPVPLNALDLQGNSSGYYELAAVLTHIGRNTESGHYIAWCRQGSSNRWWKYDDDTVSPCTVDDILKLDGGGDWHTAYLCLYRSRNLDRDI